MSYALERSKNIESVGMCCDFWSRISSIMDCSAMVTSELGRKAYCLGFIRLLARRWRISCVFIILSIIFPIIGSSEIGRKFVAMCVCEFLGIGIILVIFRASGYVLVDIEVLKMVAIMGA